MELFFVRELLRHGLWYLLAGVRGCSELVNSVLNLGTDSRSDVDSDPEAEIGACDIAELTPQAPRRGVVMGAVSLRTEVGCRGSLSFSLPVVLCLLEYHSGS